MPGSAARADEPRLPEHRHSRKPAWNLAAKQHRGPARRRTDRGGSRADRRLSRIRPLGRMSRAGRRSPKLARPFGTAPRRRVHDHGRPWRARTGSRRTPFPRGEGEGDPAWSAAAATPQPVEALAADHEEMDDASHAIRKIEACERLGGEIVVAAADVTDAAQVSAAVDDAVRRFGTIHGIVHAAGTLRDGLIQLKTPDDARAVLAPKIAGALALDRALGDRPLDFFVMFSSVSPILGLAGQVDYAAANAFLDAFAEHRSATRPGHTVSVNWGAWQRVGMAARHGAIQTRPASGGGRTRPPGCSSGATSRGGGLLDRVRPHGAMGAGRASDAWRGRRDPRDRLSRIGEGGLQGTGRCRRHRDFARLFPRAVCRSRRRNKGAGDRSIARWGALVVPGAVGQWGHGARHRPPRRAIDAASGQHRRCGTHLSLRPAR